MDIKKIEELASQSGIGELYENPKMTHCIDGRIIFIRSGELTYFGESVVNFANLIEKETKV